MSQYLCSNSMDDSAVEASLKSALLSSLGPGFLLYCYKAPSMAKMRDEEYNFCNKIVIPDTRPLPGRLWLAASLASARLERTCCLFLSASARICNRHVKVTGGHQRRFPSLSEPLRQAQTPSVSIFYPFQTCCHGAGTPRGRLLHPDGAAHL